MSLTQQDLVLQMALYVKPKRITDPNGCAFYHVMDIPGYGTTDGQWDLQETVDSYLGNVQFRGKRVLDIGAASGFLSFEMEKKGADVVAYDLSPDDVWDFLFMPEDNQEEIKRNCRNGIMMANNGFWFCWNALNSQVKYAQGTAYHIPDELGKFDVIVFGAILQHVRDPLVVLQNAVHMTKDMIIITDCWSSGVRGRFAEFRPRREDKTFHGGWTWWFVSPDLYVSFLTMQGFAEFQVSVNKHRHRPSGTDVDLFTIVAHRE